MTAEPIVNPDGSTTTEATETHARAFWATDWARFAAAIRKSRHVKCQPWTPKSDSVQDSVDALAHAMVAVFTLDAEGDHREPFDAIRFLASTQLHVIDSSHLHAVDEDQADEPDEDQADEPDEDCEDTAEG